VMDFARTARPDSSTGGPNRPGLMGPWQLLLRRVEGNGRPGRSG
jgi:hypothetical protein